MGKKVAAVTGGALLLGKDTLFGKKDPGTPDSYLELDPSLRKVTEEGRGLQSDILGISKDEIGRIKGMNTDAMALNDLARQKKGISSMFEDQTRKAQELVAQRGLGNSSVGINAILGADRERAKSLNAANASLPMLKEQYAGNRLSKLFGLSQNTNSILGTPGVQRTFVQGQASRGRMGGLFNIASTLGGAAIGGYVGGPQGAMAGMQAGQGIGNMLGTMA